jgi:hypothetical protein
MALMPMFWGRAAMVGNYAILLRKAKSEGQIDDAVEQGKSNSEEAAVKRKLKKEREQRGRECGRRVS